MGLDDARGCGEACGAWAKTMHASLKNSLHGLAATLLAACALHAASAQAQPKVGTPAPVAAAAPGAKDGSDDPTGRCPTACVQPRAALDVLVSRVATTVGELPPRVVVVSAPLTGDVRAPRGEQLAHELVRQLAGRLGAKAQPSKRLLPLPRARTHAAGAAALLHLRPKIEAGRISLRADAYPVPSTVWARALAPEPGPVAHAYATAPLDAEVRGYLRSLPSGKPKVVKHSGIDPGVVALACGDLDGDLVPEVVTVSRRRVLLGRLGDGQLRRLREAAWNDLSPIAGAPLREPLAFAAIVPPDAAGRFPGHLDVSLSDRKHSVRLDPALGLVSNLKGFAVASSPVAGCTRIAALELHPSLHSCTAGDPAPRPAELGGAADAVAATVLVSREGRAEQVLAWRSKHTLALRSGPAGPLVLGRAGAQIALGDLDQDGALDVVSSRDVLTASKDVLLVRSLLPDGRVERRFELPVPDGVRALAVCPPDGPGRAALLVATGRELWELR
jgi:hypothetical protein